MNFVIILILLGLIVYLSSQTVEGFYYYRSFNPVRGHYRDYYPRVGTDTSQYGLLSPVSAIEYPDIDHIGPVGPYRMPYRLNRVRYLPF